MEFTIGYHIDYQFPQLDSCWPPNTLDKQPVKALSAALHCWWKERARDEVRVVLNGTPTSRVSIGWAGSVPPLAHRETPSLCAT